MLCLNKLVYEKYVSVNLSNIEVEGRMAVRGAQRPSRYRVVFLFKFFILVMFPNACNID